MSDVLVFLEVANDDLCFASWRNVAFLIFRDQLTRETLQAAHDCTIKHALNYGKMLSFVYGESGLRLPSEEDRKLAAELRVEITDSILQESVVIDGGGFWGSTARSVMTAVLIFARNRVPTKVFGSVEEAADWQASMVRPGPVKPAAIIEIFNQISAYDGPATELAVEI